jgi:hypothetical protein
MLLATTAAVGCAEIFGFEEGALDDPCGEATSTTTAGPGGAAGSAGSAGAGGSPTLLDCGPTQCTLGGESACCWDNYELHGRPRAECVTGPPRMDGCYTTEDGGIGLETRIECQLADHCPRGQICCGDLRTYRNAPYFEAVRCQPICRFPDIELCHEAAYDCPEIPLQQGGTVKGQCQQSQLLPSGYQVCGYPP